ncbi:MAG: hypothetical protein HYX27_02530 [Acidobacteria bacterium]|nr:hypothetical protein [Acidobacteriota bacterium]
MLPLTTLYAADPPLRVHHRRAYATVKEQTGNPDQRGFVILTATNPKAKLGFIPGHLAGSIVLPKRGQGSVKAIVPSVTFIARNSVFNMDHIRAELTPEEEKQIEDYLIGRVPKKDALVQLEVGKRFEPVLEIRGLTVDGQPAAASVIFPTYLELELDGEATDEEEDTVVYRGVYIPPSLRNAIGDSKFWRAEPELEKVDAPDSACRASFNPSTEIVKLHVLNRLNLFNALRILAKEKKPLVFQFNPKDAEVRQMEIPDTTPAAEKAKLEVQKAQLQQIRSAVLPGYPVRKSTTKDKSARDVIVDLSTITDPAQVEIVPLYRPVRPPKIQYPKRNFRFNAFAPASNDELPLYLSGSFSSNSQPGGTQKNIANFDVRLNLSEKLVPLAGNLAFGKHYAIAPAFYAKMNTTGIVNDENSARWFIPLSVSFFPPACCRGDGKKDFHLFLLRRVSYFVGYEGGATRVTNKRTNGGYTELRLFFARVKSASFSYKFQTITGWEVGKYSERTSNTFKKAGETSVARNPDGTPVSELIIVNREGTYSRLHGGLHSTLSIGPKSSLNINFDMYRLLKDETFFDEAASVKGYFTPYSAKGFPSTYSSVDWPLSFIAAGNLQGGTRRYLDITYNQDVTKFFGIKISYNRGEMVPAFQFVNKFEAGITLTIFGSDSASSR